MELRQTLRTLASMAILVVVLVACQQGESVDVGDPGTTQAADGGTVATSPPGTDGGDETAGGTLIAAQGAEPDRLDPHLTSAYASFQILENVYDTLVQPGDDLTMEPALAESWDISDDQLTWTFHLREGVKFHNGRDLTAEDVVYSFERIMDPETGAANAYRFESVESVDAVDERTVEIRLTRPTRTSW